MQVKISNILEIIISRNLYFIPPFQRSYAWGKPQLERYFADLEKIIESDLDEKQQDKLEHFFGSIVIQQRITGIQPTAVIIDGQQRITTSLIFLIALRDSELCKDDDKKYIDSNCLIDEQSTFPDKIKLRPVPNDLNAYKALVLGNNIVSFGLIKNAYDFFKDLISKLIEKYKNITFEKCYQALKKLNIAAIILDERPFKGENPQIIFETLNSLGKPLSLSDLIRNYILLNLSNKEQTEIYEEKWVPKIENLLNKKTSEFFRDYLQLKLSKTIKTVSDNNTKEIYHSFKNYVETNFQDKTNFINDILRYSKWYKWIVLDTESDTFNNEKITEDDKNNTTIKELLKNIFNDIKSTAFIPFVLRLLEYHQEGINKIKIDDNKLIYILTVIRTYLIRRRVVKLSQGENKEVVSKIDNIEYIAKGELDIVEILSNMFYKVRLPNDIEVSRELSTVNFYNDLSNYRKFILGKIEEFRSKVSVDFRDPKITVEHIMPQVLNDSWKETLGNNWEEIHKTYKDNIGNLILTEFNSEMGNKAYLEKKKQIEDSNLKYREAVKESDSWSEKEILTHQKNMIDWFLQTFSLPDDYKNKDNWNTSMIKTDNNPLYFSPLDEEIKEVVTGSKPKELKIYDKNYKIDKWKNLYLTFIKHIKENYSSDFNNIIIENQNTIFPNSNANAIVTMSKLSDLINSKKTRESYYSLIDDDDSNPDTLFCYTHGSAEQILNRIINIMDELSMPEESVQITLIPNCDE